jgi:hypothetical protein
MFLQGWNIGSRIYLLVIAGLGFVLVSTQTLFGSHGWLRGISSFAGIAIFIYIGRICFRMWPETDRTDHSKGWGDWKVASLSICAVAILIASHFLFAQPRLHALEIGIGWLLVFLCLTFPESRWTEVALFGAYADVLFSSRGHFSGVQPAVFATVFVALILISGIIFFFLMRRNQSPSQPELH